MRRNVASLSEDAQAAETCLLRSAITPIERNPDAAGRGGGGGRDRPNKNSESEGRRNGR